MKSDSYEFSLPELDDWLSPAGTLAELRHEAAVRACADATTSEEVKAAQTRLAQAESLLAWRYDKPLPPIGDLFVHSDGRSHVVLSKELGIIRKEWLLGGHHDTSAAPLMAAFRALLLLEQGHPVFTGAPGEALRLKLSPLSKRLAELESAKPDCRKVLAKGLTKDISKVIERIAKIRPAGARSNAGCVTVLDQAGREFSLPLEVIAIDTARDLAQAHERCPFKMEISIAVEQRFERKFGASTWAKVWSHVGFSKLKRKGHW